MSVLMYSAASSSAVPPISPIIITAFVSWAASNAPGDELDSARGGAPARGLHTGRGDEGARRGGASRGDRLTDVREDGDAIDVGAGLLGVRAGHDLGPVLAVQPAVEPALGAGEALVDGLGGLVAADAHRWFTSPYTPHSTPA